MIYVPMLKTRKEELKVANNLQNCFTENIIPLFEILDEIYQLRFAVDDISKKFLYEKKGKRNQKVKLPNIKDDIITLQEISENIGNRIAFIDYFRYSLKKYKTKVDVEKVKLSRLLNDDSNLYIQKLKEVTLFENFIPVISIKTDFKIAKIDLRELVRELKKTSNVAIRLTDEFYEDYKDILENDLEKTDYFLLDIEEQSPSAKFIEFEEVSRFNIKANIIILNSPRKSKIKNGDYNENGYTDLIDNSIIYKIAKYNFSGFGDYCGLKDGLPSNTGGNNSGAALVLIYDYMNNSFWSYTNKNTAEGVTGYRKLYPLVVKDRLRFDPNRDCYGYKKIESMEKTGGWSTWHNVCASRYISQMYRNIK